MTCVMFGAEMLRLPSMSLEADVVLHSVCHVPWYSLPHHALEAGVANVPHQVTMLAARSRRRIASGLPLTHIRYLAFLLIFFIIILFHNFLLMFIISP